MRRVKFSVWAIMCLMIPVAMVSFKLRSNMRDHREFMANSRVVYFATKDIAHSTPLSTKTNLRAERVHNSFMAGCDLVTDASQLEQTVARNPIAKGEAVFVDRLDGGPRTWGAPQYP